MRGLGGLAETISKLLVAFGITLQPWMAPVAVLAIMLVLLPHILRNMRTGRARKLLRQAAMVPGPEGSDLEQRALDLVDGQPMGLVAVAEEAIRRGRMALAREAVRRLADTGRQHAHLRRLRVELDGRLPATVDEMVLIIERFVDAGMVDEARGRLSRARRRWPDTPDLEALEARLSAERPGVEDAPGDALQRGGLRNS